MATRIAETALAQVDRDLRELVHKRRLGMANETQELTRRIDALLEVRLLVEATA